MKDLFEYYEEQPEKLREVCDYWQEIAENGLTYDECKRFLAEVNKIGYTFEYGLDAEPFNLIKL